MSFVSRRPATPLEIDGAEFERLTALLSRRLAAHIDSLPSQHAGYLDDPTEAARAFAEAPPAEAWSFETLLDEVFRAVPTSFNTAGPGYLAYIPGGGLPSAALAEFLAATVNRYVGVWQAAPALAQIETSALAWLAEIVGYPKSARGVFTSGGSIANLTAIVTARIDLLGDDASRGVLYTSDQAHHSVMKAAIVAGLRRDQVRMIPSDPRQRIDLGRLETAMGEDIARGARPFAIVAAAGTTNTGAVDDLAGLADLAKEHGVWLHVDAAYGGFFCLTERGRAAMRGIDRSDSITLDPHKGLFLPYGTGAILVREGSRLRAAHAHHADYLPPMQSDGEDHPRVDFCEHGIELSRDFRGLRVWLPLKLHGISAFAAALDEKLDLTQRAAAALRGFPGVEIVAEPQLSIVAFRLAPVAMTLAETNRVNERLLRTILESGRVWMTHTMLGGAFILRICVLSFRTHAVRLDEGLEIIRRAVETCLAEVASAASRSPSAEDRGTVRP